MATSLLGPLASPLAYGEGGAIRIAGTRVSLDALVQSYRDGSTADEIVQQFPALALAEVHAAIAHYLANESEVNEYLLRRQQQATDIRSEVSKLCDQRGVRARLQAREAARKTAS